MNKEEAKKILTEFVEQALGLGLFKRIDDVQIVFRALGSLCINEDTHETDGEGE